MRKIISILLTVFLLAAPLSLFANAAQSTDEIMPRYNNVVYANTNANVSSEGKITITNYYTGINNVTTKAIITTYIERKTLGFFWLKVDLGLTNDEWKDTIYDDNGAVTHTHQLKTTGTYRITSTFEIYGSGGAADEIEKQITIVY